MRKSILIFLFVLGILSSSVFAQDSIGEEQLYDDIGDVEISGSAGLTPDSALYFIDGLVENILLVGNNPKRALKYKEEKIIEAKEMIKRGKKEEAKEAFERARKYGMIVEQEVSPGIEKEVRSSSKAVKEVFEELEDDIEGEGWEEVRGLMEEHKEREDKIAMAAKISSQIQALCKALAELDPLEYSKVCQTGEDAPKWKKQLDKELTKEQEKEAKEFFKIMSACFQNPKECECGKIKVESFSEKCSEITSLATKCEEGDKGACMEMDEMEDPIDLLPPHLQIVMEEAEGKFRDAKFEHHLPLECKEAKATTKKECEEVMFKANAPEECIKAYEEGKLKFKGEKEARKECERLMYEENAPEECIEAGLTDHKECEKFMFKLDSPQECLDAGLTGEGRNDRKKCDVIRFRLDAPQECLDAGIDGSGRDDWKKCELIRFKLDAPQECLDAGITGEGKEDWKKCDVIRFKLDAPQECLDAGLDGSGRDDWKKCEVIRFRVEVPQECLDEGLDGTGRDDWEKCEVIRFKLDAPQECLDAGLDGTKRDDKRKCDAIRFRLDAPQECLDAGLDGRGRDDRRKCDEIRMDMEERERREREEDDQRREEERRQEEEQSQPPEEVIPEPEEPIEPEPEPDAIPEPDTLPEDEPTPPES